MPARRKITLALDINLIISSLLHVTYVAVDRDQKRISSLWVISANLHMKSNITCPMASFQYFAPREFTGNPKTLQKKS